MGAAVSRSPLPIALALGLAAAACGGAPAAFEDPLAGQERRFVPQVADLLGDVGRGISITLDAEGNPHLAYLAFEEPVDEGQPPAGRPIGSPAVPAVLHAHLVEGLWTRTAVREEAEITPTESATGITVDGQGVHHVVWNQRPLGLAYANDQEGQFGEPDPVVLGPVSGASIAVGESGAPWIAWYQGSSVRTASGSPGAWIVETVATVGRGDAGLPARTSIGVGGDGQPVVAFTDPGTDTPMVGRRESSGDWSTEEIEDGGGGYAISLDLDAEGNPHVAYYTRAEDGAAKVHHAHAVGGPWEVTEVGSLQIRAGAGDSGFLSASIALDDAGTHYVAWYGGADTGVALAGNERGSFEEIPISAARTGASPAVAVAPDGSAVYVGWYDTRDMDLQMGTYGGGELVLARPVETTVSPPPPPPANGGQECPEGSVQVTASTGASVNGFDQTSVEAPAGEEFSLCFDNQDTGVPHNVHVFDGADAGAPSLIDTGAPAPGPVVQTAEAPVLEPAGYFYICDAHPTTMTGTLEVG